MATTVESVTSDLLQSNFLKQSIKEIVPDYNLDEKLSAATLIMKKEKEAIKKQKEAQKALEKKDKKKSKK